MVEQLKSRWADTPEGMKVSNSFVKWVEARVGPDALLSLEEKFELQCEFFEEQFNNLQLSPTGQSEVSILWKTAAQYLESVPIRNLIKQAL